MVYKSKNEIMQLLEMGKPVVVKDYKVMKEVEDHCVDVLQYILEFIGKEKIFDQLAYCLREIIGNAKKANTKRVFFFDESLDINNEEEYKKGMMNFKDKTISNIDYYLDLHEKFKLFVQLYFHIKDPYLNIIISNNSPILEQERQKIVDKISKAKIYNSVEDAFMNVLDDSEGAGLGIVILILILRKIGVYDKNFAIVKDKDTTHVRIAIPLSLVTEQEADMISEVLIKEIDSIPQFPDNIKKLSSIIKNKDVPFKSIAEVIRKDPSLTMDTLKMANSAHYRRLNKIDSIEHAVSIIGFKGLNFLLQSYGIKKVISSRYNFHDIEKIWQHSYNIAQIASLLCDELNMLEAGEFAYIGGLLHNIGKIVLKSLHSKTIDKIAKFCLSKNISINIIENLMDGANHFQIGAKMAVKWELPEVLINIIKNQYNPFGAPEDILDVSKIIYFANVLTNRIFEVEEYLNFEELILEEYGFTDEEKLNQFISKIKSRLNAE